jgi:two-component system sensor histidine kinase QseC
MTPLAPPSIQGGLIRTMLVGVVGGAAMTGAVLYLYVRAALLRQFDQSLLAKARALAMLVERSREGHLEFDFLPTAMPEFISAAGGEFFQMRRQDGTTFARSPSLQSGEFPPAASTAEIAIHDLMLPVGRAGRAIELRFKPRPEVDDDGRPLSAAGPAPTLLLTLARDRVELDRTLRVLASSLLGAGMVLALGAAGLVGWAVRRGLRPLRGVADRAAAINADTLDERFPADELPAELVPIASRLNDLLARLQESFRRERRFTADVAHELRTPIAELRAMAEVALKWPEDATAASGQQQALDTLAIARQMESVVATLLSLARCHAGALAASVRPDVEVCRLVRDAWQGLDSTIAARRLRLEVRLPGTVEILTDPALLSAIFANLFSNAVRYAPTGGAISCTITPLARGGFGMTLENTTDDLRPDDLPHLFEPFWRKEAARTDGSHCGLGLTLVSAYASLLGLSVEADLPAASRFRITLATERSVGTVETLARSDAAAAMVG